MILAFAFLCLQEGDPARRDPLEEALQFLARHQNGDGSWGATPKGCRCPKEASLDEAGIARVRALVAELGREEIGRRDAADRDLVKMGASIVPELEKVNLQEGEIRARVMGVLNRVGPAPERGDVELTALSLLALTGAGHTIRSKVADHGTAMGPVMRKGFEFLCTKQSAKGDFDPRCARSHALATLAFSESCFHPWWVNTTLGWDWARSFDEKDRETLAWKAILARSVVSYDLVTGQGLQALIDGLACKRDSWTWAGAILDGWERKPKPEGICNRSVNLFAPGVNRAVIEALDQSETQDMRLLSEGREHLKEHAFPGQVQEEKACQGGAWDGEGLRRRLLRTARHALALVAYYYFYDR